MNVFSGNISNIKVSGSMSQVTIAVGRILFKTVVIETPETADYLKIRNNIRILFKETEVVLGKIDGAAVSLQNRIEGEVVKLDIGNILCRVVIRTEIGNITAVITSDAIRQLKVVVGGKILALIKTNEIMLSE